MGLVEIHPLLCQPHHSASRVGDSLRNMSPSKQKDCPPLVLRQTTWVRLQSRLSTDNRGPCWGFPEAWGDRGGDRGLSVEAAWGVPSRRHVSPPGLALLSNYWMPSSAPPGGWPLLPGSWAILGGLRELARTGLETSKDLPNAARLDFLQPDSTFLIKLSRWPRRAFCVPRQADPSPASERGVFSLPVAIALHKPGQAPSGGEVSPGMSHPDESDVSLLFFFFFESCGFLQNRDCVVLFCSQI